MQPDILAPRGPYHGHYLRSVGAVNRSPSSKVLPGETAPGEIPRCDDRKDSGVSDEQLCSAGPDHRRTVPLSLADGNVLQMDQAEPEDQDLL